MSTQTPCERPQNDPCLPQPRTIEYEWMSVATWKALHADDVRQASEGGVDVLFVGDSITQGWQGTKAWAEYFGTYRSANFGIGGDATQNVLWRLADHPDGPLSPRGIVLLIGVNNLGREEHSPEETARGVRAVLEKLREKHPSARILLSAILPADRDPQSPFRLRILDTNRLLRALADHERVIFSDPTAALLEASGELSTATAPDGLHLSEEGYLRWAKVLAPEVARMMCS